MNRGLHMKKWLDELNELKKELENERNAVSEISAKSILSDSTENTENEAKEKMYTKYPDEKDKDISENFSDYKSDYSANIDTDYDGQTEKQFTFANTDTNTDLSSAAAKSLQSSNKKEVTSLHSGHRNRMRNKILNDELGNFPPHEILETLLFYCIPRRNTNPLAHKLLDHFSCLKNILNAEYTELKRCGIISEQTAFYLYFIGKLIKYYNMTFENKKIVFKNLNDYKSYLKNYFVNLDKEIAVLLFLDSSNKLLSSKKIEGSRSEIILTPKKIVELAIHADCKKLIIAHNHPGNNCKPSVADRNLTLAAHNALSTIDVDLIDHLIYAKDECYSFRLQKDMDYINKN